MKNNQKIVFVHDVRAIKEEAALEKVYTIVGSNGIIRRKITIISVEVIPNDQTKNLLNSHIEKHLSGV